MKAATASDTPALVLLHGATLNGHMWDGVRRHFKTPRSVVAPDLPGHGSRATERYTLAGARQTVVDMAASLAPRRIILGGDSLGGYSALCAAQALQPGQLAGLVLSGCSMNMSGRMLRVLRTRDFIGRFFSALIGERRMVDKLVRRELLKNGQHPEDVNAMIDAGVRLPAFHEAVEALANVDFLALLRAVSCPVLVVNGSRDSDAMRGHAEFLAAAVHGREVCFEGSKHGVSLLRAADFAAMLETFADVDCAPDTGIV
jgi:pimeloyl-ACP methyl ester carboxylesterase